MEPVAERKEIEETVILILKEADLEEMTELKVRTMAAERLSIDLSDLDHKKLVRRVVESYLLSMEEEEEQDKQDRVEEQTKDVVREQESNLDFDADGGRIICKLSEKRGVAVHDFKGNTLVSIRDYYPKEGKLVHSARGISLSREQWSALRKSITVIEDTITKMESRIRSEDAAKQIEADVPNSITPVAQRLPPVESNNIEADASNFIPPPSPRGLVPILTPRLDGKNYHCWVHLMGFFLNQVNIAYVLTEPCPVISPSSEASVEEIHHAKFAVKKWIDDDYICQHSILNSLSDPLFDQYSKKTYSAKELWEELKLAYDDDLGTKRSLVNKYIHFQIVDGVSVIEQVEELHKIANSITAAGMWIDENFHVSVIISKLPPSWKEYRLKLMLEELIPLNTLMHRLKQEEESHNCVKRDEPSVKAHVGELRRENKVGPKNRGHKRQWDMEIDNEEVKCYNCGKKGHISRSCPQRKFDSMEKIQVGKRN